MRGTLVHAGKQETSEAGDGRHGRRGMRADVERERGRAGGDRAATPGLTAGDGNGH